MITVRILFLGLTGLCVTTANAAPIAAMPLDEAAWRFGSRPTVLNADLSPDGKQVIFLSSGQGSISVARLLDVPSGNIKSLMQSSGRPESLSRCDFAAASWGICRFGGNFRYNNIIIGMTRTMAIDLRNGKMRSLSVRDQAESTQINQFDGRVIDWLPGQNGTVLMERNYATQTNALGVDRIELEPYKTRRVEAPTRGADFYLSDGHGEVRFVGEQVSGADDQLTGEMRYRYRLLGNRTWKPLSDKGEDFSPLMLERASNSLYYLEKADGRFALRRMALDGSERSELVASHPSVDIDGPIVIAPGEPVVGYRFTDDRSRSVFTDRDYAGLHAKLTKALPKSPLVSFVGASSDRQTLLIFASGDTDPGAFYVLNRKAMTLNAILDARDELAGVALSPSRPVEIAMRDGKTIPGYVTMSADGPKSNRPTVIMPHGGPSSRDEWGFDWLAQFLASRGYAVVQPNFRGSAGYGDVFLGDNAFKGWRLAMDDIADAATWSVKTGLADTSRIAILGWSYGGYAALQSAALDPRYKAVVAIAPVTDLGALRRDAEGFTDADIAKDIIGKGPHLKAGSPVHGAAAIRAPVLLVHADLDSNVRIAHSQRMERALRRVGGTVEFLRFEKLDHQIDDSTARAEMLKRIGQLLDRTIGSPG